jgi:hypothetical protein
MWDFKLLEAHLVTELGYGPAAISRIKCHVLCNGTVEGLPAQVLDPADREQAEWALETGQPAIAADDPRWSDPGCYLDVESILERMGLLMPGETVFDERDRLLVTVRDCTIDGVTRPGIFFEPRLDREIPANAILIPPELEPEPEGDPEIFQPNQDDWTEYSRWSRSLEEATDPFAFPKPHTQETRIQQWREAWDFYRSQHQES